MCSNYECILCHKKYSRKSSFDKHMILCEFNHRSKFDREREFEESGDVPTNIQLMGIIQHLSAKLDAMETKMEHMQRIHGYNNKKIDVIQ